MTLIDHDSPLGCELLAFEEQRATALTSNDKAALDRILHADLLHVHSSGLIHGKRDFIAHVGKMGGFVSVTRGRLQMLSLGKGDSAIITGPTVNRVRRLESGEIVDLAGIGTVVVTRHTSGWQVLLSQMTLKA